MFTFLHAADLHLDSPLKGLEQYEGAPLDEIRTAPRRALANLVDLALDENVAFVLIAGDVYDGDWPDYNTGLYFVQQLSRLRAASIPVYLISGNHDAANRITRALRLPDHVHLFAADQPETRIFEAYNVAIHGQSYATAAVHEDLSLRYPVARPGFWNIGLLHTCVTGREGHARYAPCTLEGLKGKGYDYWALGHVHQRETLGLDPVITFPGNLQGRHVRETGPKGCWLVTVPLGQPPSMEFRELDVVRWNVASVDVEGATTLVDVLAFGGRELERLYAQASGRLLAVRIELNGASPVHRVLHAHLERVTNELRSVAYQLGQGRIWLEQVKLRTTEPGRPMNRGEIPDDALGELEALFRASRENPSLLSTWGVDLPGLVSKLPAELRLDASVAQDGWIGEVLREAEALLLSRLFGEESPQ